MVVSLRRRLEALLDRLGTVPPARRLMSNPHARHLSIRLLIALPLLALLNHPQIANIPFLKNKEDSAMDLMMQAFQAGSPHEEAQPLAFIDIDEATYQAWGEPFMVPREKLQKLIQFAASAHPKLIFADIELSKPSCDPIADHRFTTFIRNYTKESDPILMFPQGFREPLDPEGAVTPRASFLDAAMTSTNSRAIKTSALFNIDDNDGILRRWRLFERLGPAPTDLYPSVELSVYALTQPPFKPPRAAFKELQDKLELLETEETVRVGQLTLHSHADQLEQRIIYSIPKDLPPWASTPEILRADGVPLPFLETISARCITEPDAGPSCVRHYPQGLMTPEFDNWLDQRIVVIGVSYKAARDTFDTPLGTMPGSMVIINSINTLNQYGFITRPNLYISLGLEVFIILLGYGAHQLMAKKINPLWFSLGIALLLLPLCYHFFKMGVWLTVAIPLILTSFTDTRDSVKETLSHFKRIQTLKKPKPDQKE